MGGLIASEVGGHFQIAPNVPSANSRQQYLPSTAIIMTKWLHDDGVLNITDYMPRPRPSLTSRVRPLYPWVVRRVECVRGKLPVLLELFPAFNYARDSHEARLSDDGRRITFTSKDLTLELLVIVHTPEDVPECEFRCRIDSDSRPRMLGPGIVSELEMSEGQTITFILREPVVAPAKEAEEILSDSIDSVLSDTSVWWTGWIASSKYTGRWREFIHRSAITLKLLTFEPTGAIVAAATFSLPEALGGTRQWDYRCASRLTQVHGPKCRQVLLAERRLVHHLRSDSAGLHPRGGRLHELHEGALSFGLGHWLTKAQQRITERGTNDISIMFSIHGSNEIPEVELDHLAGYKNSKPVRIGNGAATHLQLDVYGEFLDAGMS
jgi:GH15 family glucan-1,4-alpha-glucosidase